ncbi:MAG TPA: copper chaperone PCu(A)C [Allosphingosinicella sp.]|nr:copper chaperone PCu(A)C [Allosphingosinicella sp.]
MKPPLSHVALIAAALLPLAGCRKERATGVSVAHAWVRLPPVPGRAGAGYFTAKAGAEDELLGVSAPGVKIELHETMTASGPGAMGAMTGMRPLASVALPAGEPVRFTPGGKHLMIYGLDPKLKKGGTIRFTFRFRSAPPVTASAQLVGPADPPPENAGS